MSLFKKPLENGQDKELVEAIAAEKGLLAKVALREADLGAARISLEAAKRVFLDAAAQAANPDDPTLKAKRSAREQAFERVEFLEAALAGEKQKLEQVAAYRFELGKQQHLKTINRLAKRREEAAQRLTKSLEQYVIDALGFYEASGLLATSDPTPGHELSKNVLTTRGEISDLIETELARVNPVIPLERANKVVVPGQRMSTFGNPRASTPLIEKVKASNVHVLKLIGGAAPQTVEAVNG